MGFAYTSLNDQLDNLWKGNGDVKVLSTKNNKFAIISDMHMGDGKKSDDFKLNEVTTVRALNH